MNQPQCAAEGYARDGEYGLPCGQVAVCEVLCSDGRWHARCRDHAPTHIFGARRTRPLKESHGH